MKNLTVSSQDLDQAWYPLWKDFLREKNEFLVLKHHLNKYIKKLTRYSSKFLGFHS